MAKGPEIPGLSADDAFAEAARTVVATRAGELVGHGAGVLDMSDIERVHKMRVATRRLRAALEVFEPCFDEDRFKPALKSVKRLADALGQRRDPDVAIGHLESYAADLSAADRPGISTLVERLQVEQEEANEALADHVTAERLDELAAQLAELTA